MRGEAGEHLASNPPYGYIKDPQDKKRWIVDEKAAKAEKRKALEIWKGSLNGSEPACQVTPVPIKIFLLPWQTAWASAYAASHFLVVHYFPRAALFSHAAMTASMTALRKPAFSSVRTPWMVEPPGEHTASFSAPGCRPDSSTSWAEPSTI